MHRPSDRLQQVIARRQAKDNTVNCWKPSSMNNTAQQLSVFSLALLLISGFSARAEDQPMARAALPPPLPASPIEAQSPPSTATAPEGQRAAKPMEGADVQTGDQKHQAVHRARISSSKLKRAAAADRTASSSMKKAERGGHREPQPRPPEQITPGQQVAGAMPLPGLPPPLFRYYPGYPPGFVPYPPVYQYPWLPGPSLPR